LPERTPFAAGDADEALYLQGYAEGYADAVRQRFICRSNVGPRKFQSWSDGWLIGYQAGEQAKRPAE
jgi:hypothetical protein